jgi:hypothetical protein
MPPMSPVGLTVSAPEWAMASFSNYGLGVGLDQVALGQYDPFEIPGQDSLECPSRSTQTRTAARSTRLPVA